MKILNYKFLILGIGTITLLATPDTLMAQRMRGGGGGRSMNRPTTTRQMPYRPPQSRPTASRLATNRPTTRNVPNNRNKSFSKNSSSRPTVNGGSNSVTSRQKPTNRVNNVPGNRGGNNNRNPNINRNPNGNRGNGGNRVNINNNTNINVNIRNNHVHGYRPYRPPYRPYPRPPYVWGGFGFSWFRPYYYHPYTPYYWGPVWHPWGFFAATIAVTAVAIAVDNQQYQYDEGVFYVETDDGYVVVEAPQGATVKVIPKESKDVEVSPTVNNYYYGGTFYEKSDGGYTVVPPPAGAIVDALPEGGEEVKVGDQTYVKIGDTYYMPVQQDGKDMYEIVQVEEVEN